jgi:hypothetical protein
MPIASIKWDVGNLVVNSQVRASTTIAKSKTSKRPKNSKAKLQTKDKQTNNTKT